MLMFSAGAHAVAPTVLPERIEWRTAFWPLLAGRIQLSLRADGAMPAPVALEIMRKTASLGAGRLSLPASIFTGLGAPFNTLGLKGEIQLEWKRWRIFGNRGFGQLVLHLNRMQSRVARSAPLGSYRIRIQAEGDHATLELSTVHGPLLLEGRGGWRAQGGFSFQGAARARAQERDNLRPLLALLGPRSGDACYALRLTMYSGACLTLCHAASLAVYQAASLDRGSGDPVDGLCGGERSGHSSAAQAVDRSRLWRTRAGSIPALADSACGCGAGADARRNAICGQLSACVCIEPRIAGFTARDVRPSAARPRRVLPARDSERADQCGCV